MGEFAPAHVTRLAKLKKATLPARPNGVPMAPAGCSPIVRAEDRRQIVQDGAAEAEAPKNAATVADEQPQIKAMTL